MSVAMIAEKTKRALKAMDPHGCGSLPDDQIKDFFVTIGGISEAEIASLLQKANRDSTGNVMYNNLVDWLMGCSDLVERLTYGQAPLRLPKNMKDLDMRESVEDSINRKCKIICTMGPSCWDVDVLVKLIDCGMNICRLNFSHGDHEGHGACVKRIREAQTQRPDKKVAILLDTKGPEIRTGFFASGSKVSLKKGQDLKLVIDYSFKGDSTCFAVTYEKLPTAVKPGNQILIADGSLVLKVKACSTDHVMTEVMNDCDLGERKNCNLPGVKVELPVLQDKDKKDLVEFGIAYGVDFVAASFVQSADDVRLIRAVLGEKGKDIKIISKIENQEGLVNFDEICAEGDGIMVARGDLGMEIPPEKVFLAQKIMIAKCNNQGKPVVTATQMLESMGKAPRPTRAEAGDVANAVLDGTDCVMLSGETAGGMFPVEAVTIMRRVVEEAERTLDYNSVYLKTRLNSLAKGVMSEAEATCSTAVKTAHDLKASAIICFTQSGSAARQIAKYRPSSAIFAVSPNEQVTRQMACNRGVVPHLARAGATTDELIKDVMQRARDLGILKVGGTVVAVTGEETKGPFQQGVSNLVKVISEDGVTDVAVVEDLTDVKTYAQSAMYLPKNMAGLDMIEKTEDSFSRKCKIICTMGPSCWAVDKLCALIDAGMNVARLNFSHGDHEGHGSCVDRIREADKLRPDKPVAILLDTKGPEIRTGFFASGDKIKLAKGQDLKLVVDYSFKGDNTCIAVTYEKLPTAVKPGNTILIADGSLVLKVKSCGSDHVITEVLNECALGERKNCNLPGVKVDLPVLQDKDKKDLVEFGIPRGVHFVAASFVQSAADVNFIRATLGDAGKSIKIISKIENQEGLANFDEICQASDAIMVARGDLGMEIPPEKVFLAQKIMVAKCNLMGKPVITATQMLESMTAAPRPTRAEAGDVANAVLDGTDCVMLSGETAGGAFPLEAVTIMRRIVEEAEASLDYGSIYLNIRESVLGNSRSMPYMEAIASSAAKTAADVAAPLIVVFSASGSTVSQVAKYRPRATILAVTSDECVARQLLTLRGVISVVTGMTDGIDAIATRAIDHAKRVGVTGMQAGAPVVLLTEQSEGRGTSSKVVKIVKVV